MEALRQARRVLKRDGFLAVLCEPVGCYLNGRVSAEFVRELEQVTTALDEVAATEKDSWSALRRGCRTFLEHCLDPGFRRIVLLDAPSVLGWEQVREVEYGYLLRVLTDAVRGTGMGGDPTARAQLLFGALCEGGMLLARSPDPAAALPTVAAEAEHLLAALARGPGVAPS